MEIDGIEHTWTETEGIGYHIRLHRPIC